MSILQDLDPQYAKIHKQPSATWKPAFWGGSLLFVIGIGFWFLTQNQAKQLLPEISAPQAMPLVDQKQTDSAEATQISIVKNEMPTEVALPKASATIRDTVQPSADRLNTTPSAAKNTTDSQADAKVVQPIKVSSARGNTAPKGDPAKMGHRKTSVQTTAKSEKNQAGPGKQTNERDVDIITAIVH